MKHKHKKIFYIISIFLCGASFFFLRNVLWNYYNDFEKQKISAPTFIPSEKYYQYTNIGFQAVRSESLRIQLWQLIAKNIFTQWYKDYLGVYIERITSIYPEFSSPYISAQLLLPGENEKYRNIDDSQLEKNNQTAVEISLKWIKHFCDSEKLKQVNFDFITKNIYLEPCRNTLIPYYLWYIYFVYLWENEKASYRYTVAASHKDAIPWAKNLALIMQSKAWKNHIAYELYLSMLETSAQKSQNKECLEIHKILKKRDFEKYPLTLQDQGYLTKIAETLYPILWENQDQSSCSYYAGRAIRELNLWYLNSFFLKHEEPFLLKDYISDTHQGIYYLIDEKTGLYSPKMRTHKNMSSYKKDLENLKNNE